MRQIGKYRALRSLVLTLSFAALLLAAPASGILALSGGLLNPGFEEGQLDGPPQHWVVGPPSPAPDAALVVDSEGSSEFATYGDMGGVTVSPYKGVLMLRLGTPKRLAESQNRGDNTVSQSFVAQRDSLKFAFRLFSWEFRGYDLFKFNLTRQDGSPAGTLSQPLEITMPDGAIVRCTALPCQLKVDVGKRGQYLATQWTKVEVLGAPVGQLVTLSYTVSGVKDNAHATWAYIDNANTPPEATVGLDTSSPRTNDTLVATATTFDLDNDPVTLTYVWKRNGAVTKTTPVTSSLTDTYDLSVPGNGDKSDVITVEATPNDGADDGNMASAQATVINTPPVATVGLSTSSPRTNDTLVATATTSDVDNDPVTLTYVWKRNGAATKTTPATSSLVDTYDLSLPGNGDKNDVITVEATPNDSEESGDMASAQATVINTPPVATVGLDTSSPRTNDTLVATATTSDVDNDTVTLTYVWKRNGTVTKTTPATGSLVDTYDLSLPGNGDKGDVITAEATPNDGDEDGGMASAQTTVVNTPPVAKFLFTPLDATETTPVGPSLRLEGIVVQLLDRSYDVDPGDAIVSWSWTVQGPNEGPNAGIADQSASSQRPFFIPPDQGSYRVTLTVKDPDLAATTVASGALSGGSVQDGTAADGATVPALIVGNAPPLVNALNIEVLKGDDLPLLGRFLDSGWLDTHTATWEVGNGSSTTGLLAGTVQEDHTPALGTGLVTATLSASNLILAGANPGDILTGFVRVTDNAGDYRDDMFTVTVKAGDAQLRESNDSLSTAPVLTSDSAYLSYIQSLGDVDVFEVKWPGADPNAPQPLPAGAEVLVTLKGLPADYELAVLTQSPSAPSSQVAPFNMTPFNMTPFNMTPFNMTPFNMTPFVMTPFNMTPFNMTPFVMTPFVMTPFNMTPFNMTPFVMTPFNMTPFNMTPLSEVKFTGLEGTGIGGTDISLTELSLGGLLTGNAKVAGFSANRGLQDERVLVRVDVPGTRLYVAVVGANGAYSAKPYTLLVEASMPLDTAVLEAGLAAGTCSGSPLVAPSTQAVEVLQANASPLTLFVTQRERLQALYGLDNAAWSDLQDALVRLAGHDLVRGKIIFLPSGLYDGWDSNPCSIDAVNGLTASIQAEVQSQLSANPTIKYVVIVGSDDVVPYRRVPDETVISNERYYLIGSFLRPGSPLYTSVRQGYNLTDDYYVDRNPSPWQGRLLYLPDVPIGRLVETPQEIRNTAEAFLGSDGLLRRSSAFISGYDFFTDGAAAMADALASQLATQRLINDTWSAEDLRCELLGQSPCDSPADVNGINAHFTHYAALSAGGFNSANGLGLNDFLTSKEVALASGVPTALLGRIVFTMGCHAGLNVPDRSSASADPGLGIDPALDFPQAMAIQRAIYLASTGYGLGDDEGIGGTERLLVLFAKKLLQNDLPVGDALVLAKALYLGSLSAMTTYDEKSSIQTTLYGLPMYTVEAGSAPPPEPPPPGGGASLTLTVDGVQTAHTFAQVITANGSYYTADGDAQSTAGRPIEPRVAVPLPSNGSGPVHGVLLTASAFTDALGVDPVIARPTIEWEQNPLEPQACLPSFWPSDLASINSLETAGGLAQTLVVVPGQFRCTSGASPTVTGVQRLYTALTFALLRSTVEDFQPPTVSSVDLRAVNETTVALTVNASDPGGIAQVIVLRISTGDVVPVTLTLSSPLPTSGQFTLELTNLGQGEALVVQVVDGAGNVASATGKGANLSAIRVDAGIDQAFAAGIPTTLRSTVYGFEGLTAPVSFLWDFGDGSFAGGVLEATHPAIQEFTVAGGDLTFAVSHQYSVSGGPPFTATLKVTDANGGVGLDDVLVVLCSDSIGNGSGATRPDSDLAACSVATTATTMTVTVLVAGPITDLLGTDDQEDVQYRVRLDIGTYSVDPLTGARTLVSKMPDGLYDVQLRYLRGQVTGLSSLVVTPVIQDNVVVGLAFTVDLADIGRASGDHVYPIQWSSETQVGLKATSEVGISDNMPDSGLFGYVLE